MSNPNAHKLNSREDFHVGEENRNDVIQEVKGV